MSEWQGVLDTVWGECFNLAGPTLPVPRHRWDTKAHRERGTFRRCQK